MLWLILRENKKPAEESQYAEKLVTVCGGPESKNQILIKEQIL